MSQGFSTSGGSSRQDLQEDKNKGKFVGGPSTKQESGSAAGLSHGPHGLDTFGGPVGGHGGFGLLGGHTVDGQGQSVSNGGMVGGTGDNRASVSGVPVGASNFHSASGGVPVHQAQPQQPTRFIHYNPEKVIANVSKKRKISEDVSRDDAME